MQAWNLPPLQAKVLQALLDHGAEATSKELSARCGIKPYNAVSALMNLFSRGIVTRTSDVDDAGEAHYRYRTTPNWLACATSTRRHRVSRPDHRVTNTMYKLYQLVEAGHQTLASLLRASKRDEKAVRSDLDELVSTGYLTHKNSHWHATGKALFYDRTDKDLHTLFCQMATPGREALCSRGSSLKTLPPPRRVFGAFSSTDTADD